MVIYRMHAESGEGRSKLVNCLVSAKDETEACRKFRELFSLDEKVSLRIEHIEFYGILVL